ncbi:MAG TPA: N-acetylmuramoyl-L-alanine amidase [Polyangiaceae bacterium]|nr:N-acetylmuramoyl-L-alanine amidase [Polyangiaceae bacterium]
MGLEGRPWLELPGRAEVVARADQWAVRGASLQGEAGAVWLERASGLRERIWRLEGRQPDGLEAVELLRDAGAREWPGACRTKLRRALLDAEIRQDPERGYRELYPLRHDSDRACARRVSLALDLLGAYQPNPAMLAELDARGAPAAVASAGGVVRPVASQGVASQVVLPQQSVAQAARITRIERYGAKESARIVVFMTHPALFKVGVLEAEPQRGPRIYLDVQGSSYEGPASYDVGGLVERVRLGEQGRGTRLVLDLKQPVFHRIFYLPEPFRLIVDVSLSPPSEVPTAGRRSVKRVVLDPGHGGHDSGAVGPSGLREKDVTLDIAHRAAPLLARELGISTLLTRDTDDFVALPERTARANAFQADLFISIHCNASEHAESSGIMTFILDESRDALAAQLAARENAASQAAAAELANVMSRVLGVGSVSESLRFAELLQRSAMASVRGRYPEVRDQGVKRAGFYVLAGAQMPSVLYEASFISNPRAEVRLNTGDFRQKMADAIVNAVRAYREGL